MQKQRVRVLTTVTYSFKMRRGKANEEKQL